MKRLIALLVTVLFLGSVSGAIFAAPMPSKTPGASTTKSSKAHKKKKKKGTKTAKPSSTPMAK